MPRRTSIGPKFLSTRLISRKGIKLCLARSTHAALIALQQFVDKARLRNRDQHENDGDDGDRGKVEGIGSNDARLVEAVDHADDIHERGIFLQANEIIKE